MSKVGKTDGKGETEIGSGGWCGSVVVVVVARKACKETTEGGAGKKGLEGETERDSTERAGSHHVTSAVLRAVCEMGIAGRDDDGSCNARQGEVRRARARSDVPASEVSLAMRARAIVRGVRECLTGGRK
jgi:hypothetical protein